jgi:hypothetical protein
LKLPRKLIVRLDECGAATVHFQPGGPVTVCYQYIEEVERIAYGPLRPDMIAGAFVQELLHEVARGVFDVLNVPIWSRVSDAADNFAAYIMLQFGKDVALRTVHGTHLFFGAIAIWRRPGQLQRHRRRGQPIHPAAARAPRRLPAGI